METRGFMSNNLLLLQQLPQQQLQLNIFVTTQKLRNSGCCENELIITYEFFIEYE